MIRSLILLGCLLTSWSGYAQDDLLELLEAEKSESQDYVMATFKGTRLINGHSVKTREAGTMDFIISHRFGLLNSGGYNLWGLDQSNIRLGLEYAPSDRLYVGAGRNSFEKTFDWFIKYRLVRQQTEAKNIPISITCFGSMAMETLKGLSGDLSFSEKLSSTGQLLIASKISSNLSLQVMPTLIHINLVNENYTRNSAVALGMGGRYKVSSSISFNLEYYHQLVTLADFTKNALAFGVDIETGGHVFQLQLTNATAMVEKGFIGETTNDFFSGDIHFGFNISRTFQVKKRRE